MPFYNQCLNSMPNCSPNIEFTFDCLQGPLKALNIEIDHRLVENKAQLCPLFPLEFIM